MAYQVNTTVYFDSDINTQHAYDVCVSHHQEQKELMTQQSTLRTLTTTKKVRATSSNSMCRLCLLFMHLKKLT